MNTLRKITVLMLCTSLNAFALLDWETTEVSQKAELLAESVSATFHFKNTGDKAVTIQGIKTSCGCTTTALTKTTYAPGESGEIVVKLTIGTRQGLQNKTITVTSDDGAPETLLTMKTLIPQILEMKPAFVFWKKGEAPVGKKIELNAGVEALQIVKAQSDNANVTVQLDEVEPGKRYRLTVAPISTAESLKARITLVTDFPKEKPRTFYLFAHVK
jgi:hypothetical protein